MVPISAAAQYGARARPREPVDKFRAVGGDESAQERAGEAHEHQPVEGRKEDSG